jgi:antitoxin component YwqK of YwqJK toxin-antitoxin module
MELRSFIWKLLKEQLDQNTINLKNKYVGQGKPISEEDFDMLVDVTGNKFYLLSWLTKKVGQGIVKAEDIYKYKEYFDIFEKNKRKFKFNDIHLYKTADDLKEFLREVMKVREGDIVFDEIKGQDNFVSQNDIEKLQSTGGIKYLGIFDNGNYKYQVFQVHTVSQDVWKAYRDILGRCKGREYGAKIEICTIAQYKYFKEYLNDPKGSSYFLLFNLNDKRSPYQLHYESGQFMDKNDWENHGIKKLKFFEFIGGKVPQYSLDREDFPGTLEIPVKGKGKEDSQGRKSGLWKNYSRGGKLYSIYTYKRGEVDGPFVIYNEKGGILIKGNIIPGTMESRYRGPYEHYHGNGKIHSKGTFDEAGNKIGIWTEGQPVGTYFYVDFDSSPNMMSAFTKTNVLKYVSNAKDGQFYKPTGNTVAYYPSGNIKAIGKLSVKSRPLGKWTWFTPDGKIKSEGQFVGGERFHKWIDLVKTRDGQTLIFSANFSEGDLESDVEIYNRKGEFIKKISRKKIKPYPYWNNDLNFL